MFDDTEASSRAIDLALSETLVQEHRGWLRWTTSTSPALVPAPAPWRPMPVEQWCAELREAVAAGQLPDEIGDD